MRPLVRGLILSAALAAHAASAQLDPAAQPEPAPAPPAAAPAAPETPEGDSPPPAPRKAPKAIPDLPKNLPPTATALLPDDPQMTQLIARRFFNDLLLGDARELVYGDCGFPFFMEDKKFSTPEELLPEWLKILRDKRTDLLTLYGIEVLSPAEMEKKYGKPPARLANLPWHGPKTFLAVANLSGHAGVAVLAASAKGWRVVGYHD